MTYAAEFGTGQVLWSMLWLALFFIWIWLLVSIFTDIFRSDDLSGWGKAAWSLFLVVLPYIGVLTYLIARGGKMHANAVEDARRRDEMFRGYVKDVAGPTDPAGSESRLDTLVAMRREGVIDEEEFNRMKAKVSA